MISALSWVRQGAAKAIPDKFDLNDENYAEIMARVSEEVVDARSRLALVQKSETVLPNKKSGKSSASPPPKENELGADLTQTMTDELAKYHLEDYDEEGTEAENAIDLFSNHQHLTFHAGDTDEQHDSFIELEEDKEVEEEEDRDDLQIKPSDAVLVACRTEDEISYLDVYVYEEEEDNLYVHHDLMLPNFPLCLEWIDYPISSSLEAKESTGTHRNLAAVGTFDPEIEVWDLDVLELVYPTAILGQSAKVDAKKRKPSKAKINDEHHIDAVMSLSWNRRVHNLLASGSADSTVKLWDLSVGKCIKSLSHHTDKVQSINWNPMNPAILLTGSFDRTAKIIDCRDPAEGQTWKTAGDVESVKWNPLDPTTFLVSDEAGTVYCGDYRKGSSSAWNFTLSAHGKATSCIDWNPSIRDLILTASTDRTIKLWDILGSTPNCLVSRDLNVGKVFSASFYADSPNLVAAAGSKGTMHIWNLANNDQFKQVIQSRLNSSA